MNMPNEINSTKWANYKKQKHFLIVLSNSNNGKNVIFLSIVFFLSHNLLTSMIRPSIKKRAFV